MKKYKDFYDYLDLKPDDPQHKVNKRLNKLINKNHPDKSDIDINKFKDYKTIREILIDKNERAKYNKFGHDRYLNNENYNIKYLQFTGEKIEGEYEPEWLKRDINELIKTDLNINKKYKNNKDTSNKNIIKDQTINKNKNTSNCENIKTKSSRKIKRDKYIKRLYKTIISSFYSFIKFSILVILLLFMFVLSHMAFGWVSSIILIFSTITIISLRPVRNIIIKIIK